MISFGLRWHYNLKLQRYEDTYGLPHADALPLAESSRRRYLSICDTSRYPMCFVSAWVGGSDFRRRFSRIRAN